MCLFFHHSKRTNSDRQGGKEKQIDWAVQTRSVKTFNNNFSWDVYHFIFHSLFPLDHWGKGKLLYFEDCISFTTKTKY